MLEIRQRDESPDARSARASRIEEEVGDLLFAAVNVARFLGVDPEIALKKANRKFKHAFQCMEARRSREGPTARGSAARAHGRTVERSEVCEAKSVAGRTGRRNVRERDGHRSRRRLMAAFDRSKFGTATRSPNTTSACASSSSIWGEDIAVPSPIFVVAHHTGGQVLGAFDGDKMVGFTLALAAIRGDGKPFLHSHMTAVLPEYHNRGVGRRLKLFQRQDALKRGIDLIEWTFDPLELKNAHFNFMRLGAVARRYIPDCYGVTESPLHAGLPTDRLVAEWWLDSDARASTCSRTICAPCKLGPPQRISLPANICRTQAHAIAPLPLASGAEHASNFSNGSRKGYVATGVESRNGHIGLLARAARFASRALQLPELSA